MFPAHLASLLLPNLESRIPNSSKLSRLTTALIIATALCLPLPATVAETELFPFVLPWDDATPGITNLSTWLEVPAGKDGFVTVKNGHLHANGKRLRLFGTNLCFSANFPEHADAEKIAARMAKLGINCVRFHHMDMFSAPDGLLQKDMKTLDPGQLDKLDYFIAELKKHGVYSNLNLHVSRTYPDRPTWDGAPSFFKGVDFFDPGMIAQQKDYARALLTHVNPYTKTAYTDEPAVALLEINNENGLILEWWNGSLDDETMPEVYRSELQKHWNAWLAKKYPAAAALKISWDKGGQVLGKELFRPIASQSETPNPWQLERHGGAQASTTLTPDGIHLRVEKAGEASWHVQYSHPGLNYTAGQSYTLRFYAKADAPRKIRVTAAQAKEPWKMLWSAQASLGTEWREFLFVFQPGEEPSARLLFSDLGSTTGSYWLKDLSLRPGGVSGLREGETYGSLPIFAKKEFNSRTEASRTDWMAFLWDAEETYWTGMRDFLKTELKAKSLILGTAVGFSPSPIQASLDVVDSHAYWQHPHFPGKSWDRENWIVNNRPMASDPEGGTIPGLALRRVAGKPYICTEYNSSAPNTYGAETFPLIAAYGALQDWDGIFSFAYSHRKNDWNSQKVSGFFDIDQHPVKLATLPASAAIFLRGDVAPARQCLSVPASRAMGIEKSLLSGPWWDLTSFGVAKLLPFSRRVEMNLAETARLTAPKGGDLSGTATPSDTGELLWDTPHQRFTLNTTRSKALIGKTSDGSVSLGDVRIEILSSRQEWAAITLTCMDGKDFTSPGRILLAATGWAENTGMQWKNEKKNSVGTQWGKAPSLVEGITARITLPGTASRLKARALDERGQAHGEIPLSASPDGRNAILPIGPQHQTLWYEIDVR